MESYECVFTVVGSRLPATLEEIWEEIRHLNCRVDGNGYLTCDCDGIAPEYLAAQGCRPCTTMERVW